MATQGPQGPRRIRRHFAPQRMCHGTHRLPSDLSTMATSAIGAQPPRHKAAYPLRTAGATGCCRLPRHMHGRSYAHAHIHTHIYTHIHGHIYTRALICRLRGAATLGATHSIYAGVAASAAPAAKPSAILAGSATSMYLGLGRPRLAMSSTNSSSLLVRRRLNFFSSATLVMKRPL